MLVIIIILFVLVIGSMIGLTIWKIRATDPNNVDTSKKIDIERTQEFLPFEDIKDGVISLGNHQYRAIIECSSINYNLRTEMEKDVIEMSYQGFLNSLNHEISMLVQTRNVDNEKINKLLENDIQKSVEVYPHLEAYGELYLESMKILPESLDNNKIKKKYIIVPYNDAVNLTNSSDNEKYEDSLKELNTRCQIIVDGLANVGVRSRILNTADLIDLMYSSLHKDEINQSENILSGDFLSMLVDGENKLSTITDEGKLDFIIYETQMKLQTQLANANGVEADVKDRANKAIKTLDELRNELAGYYKKDFNKKDDEIYYF